MDMIAAATEFGDAGGNPRVPELVLSHVFPASREVVFHAWTDPAHAAHWWGHDGFSTVSCRMDVRHAGSWRIGLRSRAGAVHVQRGTYLEILQPRQLAFTVAGEEAPGDPGAGTLVTVTFADQGARTEVTLQQTGFPSLEARAAYADGWRSCMQRCARHLAEARPGHAGAVES